MVIDTAGATSISPARAGLGPPISITAVATGVAADARDTTEVRSRSQLVRCGQSRASATPNGGTNCSFLQDAVLMKRLWHLHIDYRVSGHRPSQISHSIQ